MNAVTTRNGDGTFDVVQRAPIGSDLMFAPTVGDWRQIVGGPFARHPYGATTWSVQDGEAMVSLEEFAPRLRGWLFRLELWFHDVVGRRSLQRAARACA